jgi:hypothetical protein
MAEDDLVDEYVRGELFDHQKTKFEDHFLCTPERRQKLDFARALRDYIETAGARKRERTPFLRRFLVPLHVPSPALGTSMAAAILLLVFGVVWLIGGYWRLHHQLNEALTEQGLGRENEQDLERQLAEERSRSGGLSDELRREQDERASLERQIAQRERRAFGADSSEPTVTSYLLAPGLFRGAGELERVLLPSGLTLVRLLLDIGVDDCESYRAALHDAEGGELWTQSQMTAETSGERTVVVLTLPSQLLPRGDYHLRLSGLSTGGDFELVARYYFRVIVE